MFSTKKQCHHSSPCLIICTNNIGGEALPGFATAGGLKYEKEQALFCQCFHRQRLFVFLARLFPGVEAVVSASGEYSRDTEPGFTVTGVGSDRPGL
jgi:hypothetical protein